MPAVRDRSSSRLLSLVERATPAFYAISALAVVLGAVAGFGGLDTVAEVPVARAASGQVVTGKQLDVTIEDAFLADGFDPYFEPDEGNRFLAVRALITNVSNTPMDTAKDNVLVNGVVGSAGEPQADEVIRIGESSSNPMLQPGVAQEVVLLWQIPATDKKSGVEITVQVLDKTLRKGFLFDDSWDDPLVTAEVPLVVGDRGFDFARDDAP
ncbi:hypothetical protein SAMN06295879_2760 [Agreia bicolorata]|uniref:DUF4352 domain-containing protein n=1 Tax=Agreia bicolorata TaxID=110935 RepID=A0A1T4YDG1_9MICO|nr:hypothetical protein [Agreia bicolorata]SKA99305.1 hypothetical protein SAMN06295879_2760 [Agreia bicolorata]